MRRRGFTMVEIAVFSAVTLVVLAGCWAFFTSSMRSSKATDVKIEGLEGAQLLARRLEKDLSFLYEDEDHPMRLKKTEGEGLLFTFYRYHPDQARNPGSTWGALPLQMVQYRYVAKERRVYRHEDEGPGRALYGTFESLGFRDPEEKDGVVSQNLEPAPSLVYFLICTPREYLKMSLEERDQKSPRIRTTLVGAVPREREANERKYFYWNRVPYWPEAPKPAPPGS